MNFKTEIIDKNSTPFKGTDIFSADTDFDIYYVAKGRMDIFISGVDEKGIQSTPFHNIFSVEPDSFYFTYNLRKLNSTGSIKLHSDILTDTEIYCIDKSKLLEIMQNNICFDRVCSSIEKWVYLINNILYLFKEPENINKFINSKKNNYEAGTYISRDKLLYINSNNDISIKSFSLKNIVVSKNTYFPLCFGTVLNFHQNNICKFKTLKELLTDKYDIGECLNTYNGLLSQLFHDYIGKANEKYSFQLKKREEDIDILKNKSFQNIEKCLRNKQKKSYGDNKFSILAACELIAEIMKVKIIKPDFSIHDEDYSNHIFWLKKITEKSDIRIREVHIGKDWFKKSYGIFLGFNSSSGNPIVAQEKLFNKYLLHDISNSKCFYVKRANKYTDLEDTGYVFYKPFPKNKIRIYDIFKLTLFNTLPDIIVTLLIGLIVGLIGLLVPLATGIIFDTIIPNQDLKLLYQIVIILYSTTIASSLLNYANSFTIIKLSTKIEYFSQAAVWNRLMHLPVSFFRNFTAGDLCSRSLVISSIQQSLSGMTISSLLGGVFAIMNVFLLFYYNSKMAWFCIGLSLIYVITVIIISGINIYLGYKIMNIEGKLAGEVYQYLSGIKKLKISSASERAFYNWTTGFCEKTMYSIKIAICKIVQSISGSSILTIGQIIIYYILISSFLKGNNSMTIGHFMAFISAYAAFQSGLSNIASSIISGIGIVPSYKRAKPIIDAIPENNTIKPDVKLTSGSIDISNIKFSYSRQLLNVLDDLSLRIKPGEFTAIVGESGSGKSTILRLLLGFEKPDSGSIFFDKFDLSKVDIKQLRSQIGTVLHDTKIMSGTIYENIAGPSKQITEEEAWDYAKLTCCADFISLLPMKMNTILMPGGTTISGGQRQQIFIARALVGKPKILFFDEASSALDNVTQKAIFYNLSNIYATKVVIAHRLSTIINADRICVLEKGKIAQEGTYTELINQDGPFLKMAKRQIL